MRRYKIAFFVVLAAAVLLGGATGYLFYQTRYQPRPMPAMAEAGSKSAASAPPSSAAAAAPTPDSGEPKLLPVQLTPQRMQSIGVKTGVVEFKTLHSELRAPGMSRWMRRGSPGSR
jgi:hypothetical protein